MTCCPTDVKPAPLNPSFQGAGTYGPNQSYYYVEPAAPAPIKGRILVIPDIFGYHDTSVKIWDRLASTLNVAVLVPDFFDGKPWPMEKMPPDMAEFGPFLATLAYENLLPRIEAGAKTLLEKSAASNADAARTRAPLPEGVVVVGFCWGALIVSRLNREMPWLRGAALIHPSFVTVDAVKGSKKPIVLVPSKDDTPMTDVKQALESAGLLAGYLFADDMVHGFCAARHSPECDKRVEETFALIKNIL